MIQKTNNRIKTYLLIGILILALPIVFSSVSCFVDNKYPSQFNVYRNIYPPINEEDDYLYYPLTATFTAYNLHRINISTNKYIDKHYFLWANRCNKMEGNNCRTNILGNPPIKYVSGENRRFQFSTYEKANTCTLAKLHNALGFSSQEILDFVNSSLDVSFYDSELSGYVGNTTDFIDVCLIEGYEYNKEIVNKIDGVVLDYEPQDSRTINITTQFIIRFINLTRDKNKSPILWTNPLNGQSQPYNGITTTNSLNIYGMFDKVSVLWSPNPSYDYGSTDVIENIREQIQIWNGGKKVLNYSFHKNIYITTDIKYVTINDSDKINRFVKSSNLDGVAIFRHGLIISHNCSTEIMQKVAFLTNEDNVIKSDLGFDGDVDYDDFIIFMACFNGSNNPPKDSCINLNADLDEDGDVDIFDYLIFSSSYKKRFKIMR